MNEYNIKLVFNSNSNKLEVNQLILKIQKMKKILKKIMPEFIILLNLLKKIKHNYSNSNKILILLINKSHPNHLLFHNNLILINKLKKFNNRMQAENLLMSFHNRNKLSKKVILSKVFNLMDKLEKVFKINQC